MEFGSRKGGERGRGSGGEGGGGGGDGPAVLTGAAPRWAQEVEEKVFAGLSTEPLFDDKVMQCLQPRIKDQSFDEQVQVLAPPRCGGSGEGRGGEDRDCQTMGLL
jgi:hypothetical protein